MRNQEQIFFLEFEKLVLGRINIYQSLSRIGFNFPSSFNSVLRKEKVPRKQLNEGKNRKIYQRYHANMLNNFSDHKYDYMQLRSVILKRVRKKYGTIFEKTIEKYEISLEEVKKDQEILDLLKTLKEKESVLRREVVQYEMSVSSAQNKITTVLS